MTETAPLVGRENDCQTIEELLGAHRLVTIVGPAGVGKTTVALEMKERLTPGFPGGTFVVELSGLENREDISGAVARQLGVDSIDAFLLRTAGAETLVVLDNCESARSLAAGLTNDFRAKDAPVTVLATSRSPLYANVERVVSLQPLALPDLEDRTAMDTPAAQLFLKRATEVGAPWTSGPLDEESIACLVRQLDGLPLAIELAAARSRVLSPAELVTMLEKQLDILTRPGRDGGRHQSLRTAIRTSYEPLDEDLQRVFRMLSVFSAPFSIELAHAVTAQDGSTLPDTLDRLTELVDASLLDVRSSADGQTQFRLLDSIRAFAAEQLDDRGETDTHHDHYAEAMAAVADDLVMAALQSFTPDVLGRIRDQFVHLANAIAWCLDNDDTAGRCYRMFIPFYGPTGGRAEVAVLAKRIRERWTEPAELQAEAWAVMGSAVFQFGDYEAGAAISATALDHPQGTSMAKLMGHRTVGYMESLRGNTAAAKEHLDKAIEHALPFSDSFARELRISRAVVVIDPAESPEALESLEVVGREAARNDEILNVVWSAVVTAYHRVLLDDAAGARRAAEAAVSVADRTGMPWALTTTYRMMGSVSAYDGEWSEARPHFETALKAALTVGDIEGVAMILRAAAGAAASLGDEELARRLWATVPAVGGLPGLRSIFHVHEEQLLAELGVPTALDSATLARKAQTLLAGPDGQLGDQPDGTGPADAAGTAASVGGEATLEPRSGSGSEPGQAVAQVIRFDDCELDLSMQELRRAGEVVHVEPQVFDVLAFLVQRRGTVVTKNDLLDEVWGNRFVSVAAISSRIAAARRATGDDGKAQRVIRTVHGKGFAFVAEVHDP